MSAMISATLMTHGITPAVAILITLAYCLVIGVINGILYSINAFVQDLNQHQQAKTPDLRLGVFGEL